MEEIMEYSILMVATEAHHQLGELSRPEPAYCVVYRDREAGGVQTKLDDKHGLCFVGAWVTGFGYINVLFPVATTRPLSPMEREAIKKQEVVMF